MLLGFTATTLDKANAREEECAMGDFLCSPHFAPPHLPKHDAGYTATVLDNADARQGECTMGDFVCDAMLNNIANQVCGCPVSVDSSMDALKVWTTSPATVWGCECGCQCGCSEGVEYIAKHVCEQCRCMRV